MRLTDWYSCVMSIQRGLLSVTILCLSLQSLQSLVRISTLTDRNINIIYSTTHWHWLSGVWSVRICDFKTSQYNPLPLSDITDCPEYPLQSVPLLTPGGGELTQIVVEWSEVLSYRDTTVLSAPPHCQVSGVSCWIQSIVQRFISQPQLTILQKIAKKWRHKLQIFSVSVKNNKIKVNSARSGVWSELCSVWVVNLVLSSIKIVLQVVYV